VIDGHDLVGIVSQADLAKHLSLDKAGQLLQQLSQD